MLYNPIGETIVRMLKHYDIQQSTLALRMDVSDTTVSRWVNGTLPRAKQWPGILKGIGCSRLEFEVELARVMCEHCVEQARKAGEVVPVFSSSQIVRQIESVLALDLDPVGEKKRSAMRRLRDVIVTVVAQCEPLLREFQELYAGTVDAAADGGQ